MKILIIILSFFTYSNVFTQNEQQILNSLQSEYDKEMGKYDVSKISDKELKNYCKSILNIYKNKFKSDLNEIPITKSSDSILIFKTDSIDIRILRSPVESDKMILDSLPNSSYVYKINNRFFWGTDGGIPKMKIEKLKVTLMNKAVYICKESYIDLYQPNFGCIDAKDNFGNLNYCYSRLFQSKDKKYLLLLLKNGDFAGAYEVIWIFKNNEYLRRIIDLPF